jgi:excisionase family DNA binding protein
MLEQITSWLSKQQAGKRLLLGTSATGKALLVGIIACLPMGPNDKTYKIPIDAPGRLLATAYNSWPLEHRPVYTQEDFERLSAISVDELARQLGWKRSVTYDWVKKGRIPSIRIGKRYCIPEDVVQRMHDYAYRHSKQLLELEVRPSHNSQNRLVPHERGT